MARALGLPNHQVIFPPGEHPSPAQWRDLLWLLETPLCGPEQYYKFRLHQYARQLRPNLKAMLLGQAWRDHASGRRLRAIRTGWRACLARPGSLGSWRSFAMLALKRSEPTPGGIVPARGEQR